MRRVLLPLIVALVALGALAPAAFAHAVLELTIPKADSAVQTAPPAVFSAFCDSRLGGDWGYAFGTLSARTDFDAILTRAQPR